MRFRFCLGLLMALALAAFGAEPNWQARLQYIEACSCNLFCPCFLGEHASHQGTGTRKCTFNNVLRVDYGKYGDLDLTGLKVWLAGDLGADWGKGQADWLVATFEPSATQQQKDAMMAIFTKLYPVKWRSVQFDTSPITWKISPDGKKAEADLGNGKGGVKLDRFVGSNPAQPSQVQNVRYFAATWNSPFALYHSTHFYKGFGKDYFLKGANGFVITLEMTSDGKRVTTARKPARKAATD